MATFSSSRVATSTNKLTATTEVGAINEIWDYAEYEITAALAANDVIQMIPAPKGARVLEVVLATDDLDTNGTPTIVLDVGDGDDTDRFIDGSTVGQAGGVDRLNETDGFLYEYTASGDTIDILVQAGPATGAATGTIRLAVCFTFSDRI